MSFRERGKKRTRKDYAHALPVFSTDTVEEAIAVINRVTILGWVGGGPALRWVGTTGTYEDLAECRKHCAAVYAEMKKKE